MNPLYNIKKNQEERGIGTKNEVALLNGKDVFLRNFRAFKSQGISIDGSCSVFLSSALKIKEREREREREREGER